MKQLWKLRLVFFVACIVIVICLGFKRNMLILNSKQGYEKYNLVINEVMVNNRNSVRDEDGDFEGWIEIYNRGDKAVNLQGFGLSNDSKRPFLWTFPEVMIEPKSFLIVWTSSKNKSKSGSHLHTNFKMKTKDKVVILTEPKTKWDDIFVLMPMGDNISYGRKPDGGSELHGFDGGSQDEANISEILIEGPNTERLEGPLFSHNGGFYTQAFELILKASETNATIYYTLDGSAPTKESLRYTTTISIQSKTNEATVVRARLYKDGYPKSEIITQSYFVDKNIYDAYNTPVISLVTDPKNLFDYEKGIYIAGKVFDDWKMDNPNLKTNQITPANYNRRGKRWEREASIEFFEPEGKRGFVQNIGVRTYGGYSRASNIKPLALFSRKCYDDREYFTYDFFDDNAKKLTNNSENNQLSRILLRTSSTDSKYALFRDAFIQDLMQTPVILDTQSSKPCIVYVNGEYYGIHNIRESYNKNYIRNHYDVKDDEVVIIKNPTGIAGVEIQEGHVGDEMHYNRMITYVKEHGLKIDSNYNFIKTQIDIDNFIEYNVLQIYCDNRDWPGNNVRIWRKRTQAYKPNEPYGHDGRWRWMVFDLDYGFGLFKGDEVAENNSLERATEHNGPDWPNPPWSTVLLRSLLKNDEFKNQFVNTFADRLNSIFLPEIVVDKIEAMEEIYHPNIQDHIIRWNLHQNKIENWKEEIRVLKNFAIKRPKYVRQHIVKYFGLSGINTIRVEMNGGGTVRVNSINIEQTDTPWEGTYFNDIPITVEAIPKPGFKFAGWDGINKSQDKIITINLSQHSYLKAVFKKDKSN